MPKKTKTKKDRAFYQAIGAKGGRATVDKHGSGHFSEAGKKGGEKVKAQYGLKHYSEIARLGIAARAARKANA